MNCLLILWAVTLLEFKENQAVQHHKKKSGTKSASKNVERKGTIHIAGPWHSESALDRNIDAAEDSYVKKIISSNEGLNFNKDMAEAGEEFELNGIDDFYDKTASITYEINGHEIPVHLKPKLTPQTKPMFPEYVKELPSISGSSRHSFQLGDEPNHPENLYSNFSPKELPEYNVKDSPSFNGNPNKNIFNSKNNVNRINGLRANYKHISEFKLPWKYADSFATGQKIAMFSNSNLVEKLRKKPNVDENDHHIDSKEENLANELNNLSLYDHKENENMVESFLKSLHDKPQNTLNNNKIINLNDDENETYTNMENRLKDKKPNNSSETHEPSKVQTAFSNINQENDASFLRKLENLHTNVVNVNGNAETLNQSSRVDTMHNDTRTSAEKSKSKERILFLLSDLTAKLKGIEDVVSGQINKSNYLDTVNSTNLKISNESYQQAITDQLYIKNLDEIGSANSPKIDALSFEPTYVKHDKENLLNNDLKNDKLSMFVKLGSDDFRESMDTENQLSQFGLDEEVQRGVGEKINQFANQINEKIRNDVASTADLDNGIGNKNEYIYGIGGSNEEKKGTKDDIFFSSAENLYSIKALSNNEEPHAEKAELKNSFFNDKNTYESRNTGESRNTNEPRNTDDSRNTDESRVTDESRNEVKRLNLSPSGDSSKITFSKDNSDSSLRSNKFINFKEQRKSFFSEDKKQNQKMIIENVAQNSSDLSKNDFQKVNKIKNFSSIEKNISKIENISNARIINSTKSDGVAGGVRSFTPLPLSEILYPNYDKVKASALLETAVLRKKFHGTTLEWSDTLSDKAQIQADLLGNKIDFDINKVDEYRLPGQNIAFVRLDSQDIGKDAIDSWASEAKDYDFKSPLVTKKNTDFVQLMWKSNKKFGMGVSKSKAGDGWIVTSFYDSPFADRYNDLRNNIESDVPIDDPYSDITG
ncbi:probable cyclin-dependent serine/threonine-protein kinase DDB_G0292550 isoform X1 [Hydra vulgaris]|uniref:probable cyclin-dependent serine/threonine-protein kinase DDB_G0292550 isoform X1 n=1 Tax=Hydra vulgaris TaxID=6087 RepID=UPI000640F432|nr:probable cyclin-dependent serine/threonine-protein kinase DDB_G0292550 [Hydra vulgaris]